MTFSIPFGSSDDEVPVVKTMMPLPYASEACSMAQMRNEETGIQIEFSSETDAQIHTDTMRLDNRP